MPSSPISAITRMNSTVKDLFIYLYDLSPLELDLLFFLIKNKKPLTMEELARKADRDKVTIFRSLQKLVGLGICIKDTKTLKKVDTTMRIVPLIWKVLEWRQRKE